MSNDFLVFGGGGGANVVSQAAWASLAQRLSGFTSGVAQSAQLNKAWRQSSIMAAVLGQFISDQSGQDALDDGTTATLVANLLAGIRAANKTQITLVDTGAANAYAATNMPALLAGTWVDGVTQRVKITNANTGASTYSPDGLTAIPIYGLNLSALQGGELRANCVATFVKATVPGVNSGNPVAVLLHCYGAPLQIAAATQSNHAVNYSQVLGVGQTLQDLTASRALGTTYTNSTGKPILVEAIVNVAVGQSTAISKNALNTVNFGNPGSSATGFTVATIVLPGQTYSVTASGASTLSKWYETR